MADNSWLSSHVICPYPFLRVARACCLRCGFHHLGENLKIFEGINTMSKRLMAENKHPGGKIESAMVTF